MKQRQSRARDKSATIVPAGSSGDALDQAILALLRRLPLTWEPLDSDALTAMEQEALRLLTGSGLIERRLSFRLSLIGHPLSVEATITATGEYGLVEALTPVTTAAWDAWAADYRKGKAGSEEDRPRFHCERTGAEQVRVTQDGEQARRDVEMGDTRRLLAFVHRREPGFVGKIVRGEGKAEKIRTQAVPSSPLKVELVDSGPMAAVAEVLQKLFDMQQSRSTDEQPDDLITTEVAISEYATSRATIRRKIKAGELRDYRPPNSPANAKLLLSRAELGRVFAHRK